MFENAGLSIWIWILVGNAIGIFILNGTGGSTTAMSARMGFATLEERSIIRRLMNGPRSTIVTITLLPLLRLYTRTLVSNGSVDAQFELVRFVGFAAGGLGEIGIPRGYAAIGERWRS